MTNLNIFTGTKTKTSSPGRTKTTCCNCSKSHAHTQTRTMLFLSILSTLVIVNGASGVPAAESHLPRSQQQPWPSQQQNSHQPLQLLQSQYRPLQFPSLSQNIRPPQHQATSSVGGTASGATVIGASSLPNNNFQQNNPYIRATHELLLDLRQQMLTKSIKFDEHFKVLLRASKVSLHNMFVETYGMMYEHNTEIFTGMFESLEQYYATGQIKLTESMENFFQRLYQKIFQVINTNRIYPPDYLECATNQLTRLKPFGDVPDKIVNGIRHALVAARTFVQALNNGIDFMKGIISIDQPAFCIKLINEKLLKNTQIQGQNQSPGSPPLRPICFSYCEQVIQRCIGRANIDLLNDRWRAYIAALSELAMKLSTSYNLETIIAPLDVQISEGIMNYQENSNNITQRVHQVCGIDELPNPMTRLQGTRIGKRSAYLGPIPASPSLSNNHQNRNNQLSPHNRPLPGQTLVDHYRNPKESRSQGIRFLPENLNIAPPIGPKSPVLIDEIKNYMNSIRSFWSMLPTAVCSSNYTLGPNPGGAPGGKKQASNSCYQDQFSMWETNSDIGFRRQIQDQVNHLDSMRLKIESALAGVEIDWSVANNKDHRTPSDGSISTSITTAYGPIVSTTTTTTTPPDNGDVDDDDDPNPDPDPDLTSENGSTTAAETDPTDPDEQDDPTTEYPFDPTDDSDTSTGSEQTSDTDPNEQEVTPPSNYIDLTPSTSSPNNEPRKIDSSGSTSSKLVIGNQCHLSFAFIMSAAFLIVTNFQRSLQIFTIHIR